MQNYFSFLFWIKHLEVTCCGPTHECSGLMILFHFDKMITFSFQSELEKSVGNGIPGDIEMDDKDLGNLQGTDIRDENQSGWDLLFDEEIEIKEEPEDDEMYSDGAGCSFSVFN